MNHFPQNLSLLCSYHRSVSEVCRKLNINRSQFNKYLKGDNRPSRQTLRKICDFFGVEEHEILLPEHQFSRILQVRPMNKSADKERLYSQSIESLQQLGSANIGRYEGYYFEYYYSMSYPGYILRSLVKLTSTQSGAYYKRIERLQFKGDSRGGSTEKSFNTHYQGMAFYLGDRLFLVDYEHLTKNEITQTILFPSYKTRTTYLTGLKLGAAAESRRTPSCARVVYEVLGQDVNLRAALKLCGLYHSRSEAIAPDIKTLITNTIGEHEHHLVALPL